MCSWPKYPIKNTGGSAIQVTGISSFQFWTDRRPSLWATEPLGDRAFGRPSLWAAEPLGGAACPCGARCAPPPERMCWACCSLTTVRHPVAGTHPARERALLPCVRCLALPARGAAGVRVRRCLPCGQRRCRVARRIMACRGRERVFRSGLPIREIYQRAGERGNGPHPAGDGDTRHLADRTRPSPGTRAQPQLSKTFPRHLRPFHACLQPSRAHKSQLPTLPATASSPRPSRRENGGLCPHPLKGPDP